MPQRRSPYEAAWQAWKSRGGSERGEPMPRARDFEAAGLRDGMDPPMELPQRTQPGRWPEQPVPQPRSWLEQPGRGPEQRGRWPEQPGPQLPAPPQGPYGQWPQPEPWPGRWPEQPGPWPEQPGPMPTRPWLQEGTAAGPIAEYGLGAAFGSAAEQQAAAQFAKYARGRPSSRGDYDLEAEQARWRAREEQERRRRRPQSGIPSPYQTSLGALNRR